MTPLEQKMLIALRVVQEVITEHGFGGLDQNPKGVHDLVGHAILEAEREKEKKRGKV